MFTGMEKKRPYRMRERAKSQAETRLRIVEAAMRLHEEIGPRATTISAIAETAGVQRLTVYRHFPDEEAVFTACTSHWLNLNPPPDPASWSEIGDPRVRLRAALDAFYRYYRGTQRMWTASHRDMSEVPALQGPMAEFSARVGSVAAKLAAAFGARGQAARRLEMTIRHTLAFTTWTDLEISGANDEDKVELAALWADAAARGAED